MTTTDQTTHGTYEMLEQLAHVQPDPAVSAMCERVTELVAQVRPVALEARRLLEQHEAMAGQHIEALAQAQGADVRTSDGLHLRISDGLHEIAAYKTGADACTRSRASRATR